MLPAAKALLVTLLLGGGTVGTYALAGGKFGSGSSGNGNAETTQVSTPETTTPTTDGQARAGDAASITAESPAASKEGDTVEEKAQDEGSSVTLAGLEGKENTSDTLSSDPSSTLGDTTTRNASNPVSEDEATGRVVNAAASSGRSEETPQINTNSDKGPKVEPESDSQDRVNVGEANQEQPQVPQGDVASEGELQEAGGSRTQETDNPPASNDQTEQKSGKEGPGTGNETNQGTQDQSNANDLGNTNDRVGANTETRTASGEEETSST